jgi:NADH-quinone oxidoreductase subunit A
MEIRAVLPVFLFIACVLGLGLVLLAIANVFNPKRPGPVKRMPYESGMDPFHDTRRRFDVRFHLLAIAFLVFDVELLFLYPWAVAMHRPAATGDEAAGQASEGISLAIGSGWIEGRDLVFAGAMIFIALLALGFLYDWRKKIFQWR